MSIPPEMTSQVPSSSGSLATYHGRQMADGILGKEVDNPFADLPMPRVPLYQAGAWMENLGKA
jgi:hypothetical protein